MLPMSFQISLKPTKRLQDLFSILLVFTGTASPLVPYLPWSWCRCSTPRWVDCSQRSRVLNPELIMRRQGNLPEKFTLYNSGNGRADQPGWFAATGTTMKLIGVSNLIVGAPSPARIAARTPLLQDDAVTETTYPSTIRYRHGT